MSDIKQGDITETEPDIKAVDCTEKEPDIVAVDVVGTDVTTT